MSGTTALPTALDYLARGWAVIPVQPRSKHPLVRWQAYQTRHPTEKEIRGWFEKWPDANIGVVTGAVSGIVVLDVDPKYWGDDSLADLEKHHGDLPETVEATKGGGGRHIYFAHPGHEVRNRTGLAPGIDLRGDGGMIVAPPSIHPSGRPYAWEVSHHPDDIGLPPMPRWLLSMVGSGGAPQAGHPLTHWRDLTRNGVSEGVRNATIASLTGHLLWHGVDDEVALELLLCWNRLRCRPPLSDDEVLRTVQSVSRTHRRHHGMPPEDR